MRCIDSRNRAEGISRRFKATEKNSGCGFGDYRLFFATTSDDVVEVRRVHHRRQAYR
jgi:mRNA-degrading endonuclease RelE of RelBE toxin-antitoxin system